VPADLERLEALIRDHWAAPHLKVLTCAPDVWRKLQDISREAEERDPGRPLFMPAPLMPLLGIQVRVQEGREPGWWRMIRHDHCEVSGSEVTHDRCTWLGGRQ
jgi:hypothetical protein